jgi:hypothetical protein
MDMHPGYLNRSATGRTLDHAPALAARRLTVMRTPQDVRENVPRSVPLLMLDRSHALRHHDQSLERLDARGGMTPGEIACNVLDLVPRNPARLRDVGVRLIAAAQGEDWRARVDAVVAELRDVTR